MRTRMLRNESTSSGLGRTISTNVKMCVILYQQLTEDWI